MFLSIIIPVHNVENYLDDCISSVLNQDYEDYEVLLIENASTDKSLSICKKYSDNPKVSVYSLPESGVSHARNFGIRKAIGKYIWFVDGDDMISKNSISYLNKKTSYYSNPDILIFTHNEIIDGKHTNLKNFPYEKTIDKITAINGLFDVNLWNGFICNKLIKNDPSILNECLFPEDIHMIEDLSFFTKIFKHFNTFAVINKCLYSYRKREGSISTIFDEKKLSSFKAYEIILKELGDSKDFKFAKKIIYNASVDFSRQILTHYYFHDKTKYHTEKNKYKKLILKNFKYITHAKAKIAAFLILISPKLSEKMRKINGK